MYFSFNSPKKSTPPNFISSSFFEFWVIRGSLLEDQLSRMAWDFQWLVLKIRIVLAQIQELGCMQKHINKGG